MKAPPRKPGAAVALGTEASAGVAGLDCNVATARLARLAAVSCLIGGFYFFATHSDVTAQEIGGQPHIVDGDTLAIGRTKIRLVGIDAPERGQPCASTGEGAKQDCGKMAAGALRTLAGLGHVVCYEEGKDRYKRFLATCWAGEKNLNREMVRTGFAFAYRKYSSAFAKEEAEARSRSLGIWRWAVQPPWEWRREKKGGHR